MSDWSKDIDLEIIKEYLQECAENDDYHYEQYQVDILMYEYIRQKQVIQAIINENEKLTNIINKTIESVQEHYDNSYSTDDVNDIGSGTYDDLMEILKGVDKE